MIRQCCFWEKLDVGHCWWLKGLTREAGPCEQSLLFFFFDAGGDKDVLPESRQAFEIAGAHTSGLVNIVFSGWFFERQRLFIDRAMVITRPTIPSAHGY